MQKIIDFIVGYVVLRAALDFKVVNANQKISVFGNFYKVMEIYVDETCIDKNIIKVMVSCTDSHIDKEFESFSENLKEEIKLVHGGCDKLFYITCKDKKEFDDFCNQIFK